MGSGGGLPTHIPTLACRAGPPVLPFRAGRVTPSLGGQRRLSRASADYDAPLVCHFQKALVFILKEQRVKVT